MPYFTAYNGTDAPVVIDGEGRTIGGGEWAPVLSTEDAVSAALEAGTLTKVKPVDGDDVHPDAAAAFAATAELEAARGDADDELEAAEATKATPTKRARRASASTEEN